MEIFNMVFCPLVAREEILICCVGSGERFFYVVQPSKRSGDEFACHSKCSIKWMGFNAPMGMSIELFCHFFPILTKSGGLSHSAAI